MTIETGGGGMTGYEEEEVFPFLTDKDISKI